MNPDRQPPPWSFGEVGWMFITLVYALRWPLTIAAGAGLAWVLVA